MFDNTALSLVNMLHRLLLPLAIAYSAASANALVPWNETRYLFTLGDSYTASGYNISQGIDSPEHVYVSSNLILKLFTIKD